MFFDCCALLFPSSSPPASYDNEFDRQRREGEKRLQEEQEAKRELLRQEKIRVAEERVVEERRARLLQEREEHEVI